MEVRSGRHYAAHRLRTGDLRRNPTMALSLASGRLVPASDQVRSPAQPARDNYRVIRLTEVILIGEYVGSGDLAGSRAMLNQFGPVPAKS
jgi:hypothetical protein